MAIHGLSMASQIIRIGTAATADSRVIQETPLVPSTAATPASTPAAIYHPSAPDSASTLSGPGDINVYSWDPKLDENRRMRLETLRLWLHELPAVSVGLHSAYETATATLSPELSKKDWGFSVSNGELVILKGRDSLSDEELATLKLALAAVTPAANGVADTAIRMIELDRGTNGVSNSIGRFDVSTQNFADIVDLRKYLLAHGPDGKYNQARDPSDLQSVYGTGGWAIMDQVAANAAVRFSLSRHIPASAR
jgi:hypothetical protein